MNISLERSLSYREALTSLSSKARNRIEEALRLIEQWSKTGEKVLVLAKRSADGACSAMLLSKLLSRYGCLFEARAVGLEDLLGYYRDKEQNTPSIILDLPVPPGVEADSCLHVSHLPSFPRVEGAISINTELMGIDGTSEACTSSLVHLLLQEAGVIDEACLLALCVGIQGEGQVRDPPSPLKGLNENLLSPSTSKGVVVIERSLQLFSKRLPLITSLAATLIPPLKRIMGSEEDSRRLLEEAGFRNVAEKPLMSINEEDRERLIRVLLREVLSSGLDTLAAEALLRPTLKIGFGETFEEVGEATRLIDVCVKAGKLALAVQPLLHKPPSLFDQEGLELATSYSIQVAKTARLLINQLTGRGAHLFEIEPRLRGFTLDVAKSLALISRSTIMLILSKPGPFLKVSAFIEALESAREKALNELALIAEDQGGLAERGSKWVELAAPLNALVRVEKLVEDL